MPAISFSGETSQGAFWEQILEERKTQTCRRPRKRPINPGAIVTLYWRQRVPKYKKPIHKIALAQVTKVERKEYRQFAFNDVFAQKEGFKDSAEMRKWFGDPKTFGDDTYDVITFRVFIKYEANPLFGT